MLQLTTTQTDNLNLDYSTYIDSLIKEEKYIINDVNTNKVIAVLANAYREIILYYNDNTDIFTDEEIRLVVSKYNNITGHNLTI